MADRLVAGSLAYPRDLGTDAPEDYVRQDSAGFIGGLARHRTFLDYVEEGMTFYPDWGASTLDIGSGLAHVLHYGEEITVQDQTGSYSIDWPHGMGVGIGMPKVEGLALESNAENHVYLDYRPQLTNPGAYVVNSTDSHPGGTALKLGVVDTDAEEIRYADAHLGMTAHFGTLTLGKTTGEADSATRREWVLDRLSDLNSELSDAISSLSTTVTEHINATVAHSSNGDVAGSEDVDAVAGDLQDHDESNQEHGSNGAVAGMNDIPTNGEIRTAVDGSNVSVAYADEAGNAATADQAGNAATADFASEADSATQAGHAGTADSASTATLWADYELVFDDETPSENQYIRFETE